MPEQEEPVNVEQMLRNAYEEAYENPIKPTADWGVHADSMPRVRAFAGNEDHGYGTYTDSVEIEIEVSTPRGPEVQVTESEMLVDDVARAMIQGSRDRYEERDPDPERAL